MEEEKRTEIVVETEDEEVVAVAEESVKPADGEDDEKEKKPGFFAKRILEGKIKSMFEKANAEFVIYTKNEAFSNTVYGKIDGDKLTVFGKQEIKPAAVVVAQDKKARAYYVVGTAPTTVTSAVEGVTYERPGTIITLDENVEEVNVVKAGKRYFIYKGTDKK